MTSVGFGVDVGIVVGVTEVTKVGSIVGEFKVDSIVGTLV
jgi:hypothetical protein